MERNNAKPHLFQRSPCRQHLQEKVIRPNKGCHFFYKQKFHTEGSAWSTLSESQMQVVQNVVICEIV